ncbi:hypothetical protein HK101_004699, partial [Irineochytrium annulatum]
MPLSGWLLKAHTEANTGVSVILAAILLKLGSYGIIRFVLPLLPVGANYYRSLVILLCIIGIIYCSLATLDQIDIKIVIAYSSIVHQSASTIALVSGTIEGLLAGIYSLISHGLISSGLFLLVGVVYDRYHTRTIKYYRGLIQFMPLYIVALTFFSLANASIPGTSGFVAEFLILLGIMELNPYVVLLSATSIVLVPIYMMAILHRISYGSLSPYLSVMLSDLTTKELHVFFPLILFTIYLGILPQM